MTLRFAQTSTAALALTLLAAAPALACPASVATSVRGYDNVVDAGARGCAQLGVDIDGAGNEVEAFAAGAGSRLFVGARDSYTRTVVRSVGHGNQIGTLARSGGQIGARVSGNDNEMALRAQSGGRIRAQVTGDSNYVRVSTY